MSNFLRWTQDDTTVTGEECLLLNFGAPDLNLGLAQFRGVRQPKKRSFNSEVSFNFQAESLYTSVASEVRKVDVMTIYFQMISRRFVTFEDPVKCLVSVVEGEFIRRMQEVMWKLDDIGEQFGRSPRAVFVFLGSVAGLQGRVERGKKVAEIERRWGALFSVRLRLMIHSHVPSQWASVLAFKASFQGKFYDCCEQGDRAPAIYLHRQHGCHT